MFLKNGGKRKEKVDKELVEESTMGNY